MIAVTSLLLVTQSTFTSCKKETTGNVTVVNIAPYRLKVDVTWSNNTNDERWINSGSSTTYYNIPEGTVTIWSSDDGYDWISANIHLSAGQHYTYTWHYK